MLKLKNICKNYAVAGLEVQALKNVNLSFRKSEFVSILGPSGCGKTTMLNIIGGLDRYTSGDLIIEGKSTKEFVDKDWDYYRNHSIGFVFQSYNLIPHQTILQNVELALQIAGLNKQEREEKAKKSLDKVGLKGLYNKKPNQLSGGQCQRVAIARALVNEPEILLADEPTGALDTATSVQIMDLIKEIAKERLVIMVTHNPDLAIKYSSRIIKLLDGEVIDDSNPFLEADEQLEVDNLRAQKESEKPAVEVQKTAKNSKKLNKNRVKMSFWTAFKLSFKNLTSKKARTVMMSIAGSIGIVGISLVLSISYGVKSYIANMQNDMLSGNPISISRKSLDYEAMMTSMDGKDKLDMVSESGYINIDKMIEHLVKRANSMNNIYIENDINNTYLQFIKEMPSDYYSSILYDFDIDVMNNLYVDYSIDGTKASEKTSLTAIKSIYASILDKSGNKEYSAYLANLKNDFKQAPTDSEYLLSQYNLVDGKIATSENEIMVVLDKESVLKDILLARLGYYTQEQYLNIVYKATNNSKYNPMLDINRISFDKLKDKTFTYYKNDDVFTTLNAEDKQFSYKSTTSQVGEELKIVGILEPKENISYGCMRSGFYYTEAFTKKYIEDNYNSKIATILRDSGEDYLISSSKPVPQGVTFRYSYQYDGTNYDDGIGFVGKQLETNMSSHGESAMLVYGVSLNNLGGDTLPYDIIIFNSNFEQKDKTLAYLDRWNSDGVLNIGGAEVAKVDRAEIKYSDKLSLMITMINTFINIVTYSLLGFTALSLVVSSFMIGIITYISVVERIKEIGVIRSLGGRKRDVSNLFISETFIIGASSGIVGVVVTYILSAIINAIINSVLAVKAIAIFPYYYALTMFAVSVLLTLISGLIPARSAAKKDPVTALRTE